MEEILSEKRDRESTGHAVPVVREIVEYFPPQRLRDEDWQGVGTGFQFFLPKPEQLDQSLDVKGDPQCLRRGFIELAFEKTTKHVREPREKRA